VGRVVAVVRLVWLECDECKENTADTSERLQCGTSAEAWALARDFGWIKRKGKILCDECKRG
jgi:hypothetical protein